MNDIHLKLVTLLLALSLVCLSEGRLKHHKRKHIQKVHHNSTTLPQNASRRDSLGFLSTFHKDKAKFKRLFANKLNQTLNDQGGESVVTFFPLTSNIKKNDNSKKKKHYLTKESKKSSTVKKISNKNGAETSKVNSEANKRNKKSKTKVNTRQSTSKVKNQYVKPKVESQHQEKNVVYSTDDIDSSEQSNLFDLPEENINVESKHVTLLPHLKSSKNKATKFTSNIGEFNLEGLTKDLDKTIFDTAFSGSGDDTEASGSKSKKSKKKVVNNITNANALRKVKSKTVPVDQTQSSISTDQADHARSSAAGSQFPNFPVPPMMPIPLFYNSGDEEGSAASGMTDVKPSKDIDGGESGLGEEMAPTTKAEVSGDWVDKILADQNKNFDDDNDDEDDEDEKEEKHARKINNLARNYDDNHKKNKNKIVYNQNIQPQQKTAFVTPNQILGVPNYPSIQYTYPNVYFQPLTYYQAVAKRLQQQKALMASQLLRSNMINKGNENACSIGCNPQCAPSCDPLCCQGRADVSKFEDKDIRIAHEAATEAKSDMLELQNAIKSGEKPLKLGPPPNTNTKISEPKITPSPIQKPAQASLQNFGQNAGDQQVQAMQPQQQQNDMQQLAQLPIVGLFATPAMFQQNQQFNQQVPAQAPQVTMVQPHQQMMQYAQAVPEANIQHMQPQQQQPQQQQIENTNNVASNYGNGNQQTNNNKQEPQQGKVDTDLQAAIQKLPEGNIVPLPDMMIDNSNNGNTAQFSTSDNTNNQNMQMYTQQQNVANTNQMGMPYNIQQNYAQMTAMPQMMAQAAPTFTGVQTQKDVLGNDVNMHQANADNNPTPSHQHFQSGTTESSHDDTTTTVNPQVLLGPNNQDQQTSAFQQNQDSLTSPATKDGVSLKPISYPNPIIAIPAKFTSYALKPVHPIMLNMQPSTNNDQNKNSDTSRNLFNTCHAACARRCLPFCSNYCCGIASRRTNISRHKSS